MAGCPWWGREPSVGIILFFWIRRKLTGDTYDPVQEWLIKARQHALNAAVRSSPESKQYWVNKANKYTKRIKPVNN